MPKTFAELQADLQAEDLGIRMKVLPASRALSESERFQLVIQAVNDPNSRIRYDAISQLGTLGQQDINLTQTVLKEALWHDPEMDVRAAAADSIAALGLTASFTDLAEVYQQTNDWLLQFSIIAALGELGDERAYPLLVQALQHENDLIKTAAIGALGELDDPTAVEALRPFVAHPDWQIRYRLAQALVNLGTDEAKELLIELRHDPDPKVASMAQS
ncbi:MAG: HEAT repeat domain-containing protein [Pseudanabaenaceae cyanobacterium]